MRKILCVGMLICTAIVGTSAYADNDDTSLPSLSSLPAIHPLEKSNTIKDPTTTLKVSEEGNRLIATTITNRSDFPHDELVMKWIAPENSFCANSTYPIKAGANPAHDVFWAYRTLTHTYKGKEFTCSGTWTVKVINNTTGQTLDTQDYIIH